MTTAEVLTMLRNDIALAKDMAELHGLRGDKLMTDYFIGLSSRLTLAVIELPQAEQLCESR